jgi:Protein of unknown function (DUF2934)
MAQGDLKDRIERRAYALWEKEGRPEGRADEHWHQAEAEVIGAEIDDKAGPGAPGAGLHAYPACEGTGRRGRGRCKQCGGTGRIVDAPEP